MTKAKTDSASEEVGAMETCGVIMPISAMGIYDASHWADVRRVLYRSIELAGMKPQIVSDSLETDVIQERIILNLYENPVVVCDVSGLNPNVMFELGMRLTFKKPTIIVTDDVGSLPFDTRIIEHVPYPRDLRFHLIEEFIDDLSKRIVSIKKKSDSGSYKSFIESFGKFETASPERESVPIDKYVLDRLDQIAGSVRRLERTTSTSNPGTGSSRNALARAQNAFSAGARNVFDSANLESSYFVRVKNDDMIENLMQQLSSIDGVDKIQTISRGPGSYVINIQFNPSSSAIGRSRADDLLTPYFDI